MSHGNYDNTAFVIISPIGVTLWNYLRVSKDVSIAEFTKSARWDGKRVNWEKWYELGYRAVKVGPLEENVCTTKALPRKAETLQFRK